MRVVVVAVVVSTFLCMPAASNARNKGPTLKSVTKSILNIVPEDGRWYPEFFRINFSRCIFCGMCEEACPTSAIQLTPDFEMGEYDRQQLVYEKEDLLINGPGKDHDYHFYKVAGMAIGGKDKGEAKNEEAPEDVRTLLP